MSNVPGTPPRDRPYPAVGRGRGAPPRAVALPLLGAAGVGAAVLLVPAPHRAVVLLLAALLAVAVLAVLLVTAVRARRAAEEVVAELRVQLDAARDEHVVDEVTGLLNRQGVSLLGHQVLESARRSGGAVHACVVETAPGTVLGGTAGTPQEERVRAEGEWRAVAAALRGATRTSDVVAREDGGRFIVLGPGAGLHAQELERRVRVGLAQGRLSGGGDRSSRTGVEVGAAVLTPWDEGDVTELLVRAEQSLVQRRSLRRSVPQHGWSRRRNDHSVPQGRTSRTEAPRSEAPHGEDPPLG